MIDELLRESTPEMFSEPYRKYAEVIGVKNLYNLSKVTKGERIYIPKPSNIIRPLVKLRIVEDHRQGNATLEQLAEKYDLSLQTVWRYCKGIKDS